ncbi:MAG TPA: TlpA disulfide reductase family protein [Candidatus Angelobacter sp.]|nr:TlpA disulfide reductase family protein [Candidatus Angelobacter sp.]
MKRGRLIAAISLAGAVLASVITCVAAQSGSKPAEDKSKTRRPISAQAEMLPDAPDFELKTLDGKTVHLRDYQRKAVLLNFWATWCVPCKEEIPWLIDFQKQYGPKGLVILGIAMDSSSGPIKKFTGKFELNYPILLGNQVLADRYYVKALPVSVFIDRNGRITDQVPGAAARSFIEDEIQLALENGGQSSAK